jgi:hypothetical protein
MNMTAWLPSLQIAFSPERVTRLNEVPLTTDDSGVSTQSSASENRGVSGGAGGAGATMGGVVCSGLLPPPQAVRDKEIAMITERMIEKFLRYRKWIDLYTEFF